MTALATLPEIENASPARIKKLKAAKIIYQQILNAESGLRKTQAELLQRAWYLGAILDELKDEIGHGKWILWLEGSWPELGERNAQRCMQFFKANPRNSTDLDQAGQADNDSVRKFFWHYIPAKERPALEGDEPVSSKPHYLSFVNHWTKWKRQLSLGHVPTPPIAQFQREMETPLREIIEIGGKDWAQQILNI